MGMKYRYALELCIELEQLEINQSFRQVFRLWIVLCFQLLPRYILQAKHAVVAPKQIGAGNDCQFSATVQKCGGRDDAFSLHADPGSWHRTGSLNYKANNGILENLQRISVVVNTCL